MPHWIAYIIIIIIQLLIPVGICEVLFEQNFSEPISGDHEETLLHDGSLDFKFHQENGGHLYIKDYDAGIRYSIDSAVINPAVHKTLYLSFCLQNLNPVTKEKFAGIILYQNGQEVFGLGNDWKSDTFSFWESDGSGIVIGDIPTQVDAGVHKIVMRVDFDAEGPETIKVGLDPFCRRSESRQPNHIWTTHKCELNFNEIRIRCGDNNCAWGFDEIRIGTDWQSVTPSDDNPGAHITRFIQDSLPGGKAELIQDGVGRFWPSGINDSEVLPSLAIEKPVEQIGSVPDSWALFPKFGISNDKKYVYLNVPAEVDLYGTGEVTGSLLRNGYNITLFNKDNYGYGKPDQLYQSHPWVLGVRPDGTSFGIIFDTPWRAELDLRAGILFTVPKQAPPFPTIIIEGKSPQEIMIKLTDLTGRMPMPPRWALGYQQCRYSYYPDARVREIVDMFRAKRIPCDVLWFDIDYMDGFRIFTVDSKHFPDPDGINSYLHSLGFKSVWMIDPGVKHDPGYAVYESGTQSDVWVRNAAGTSYIGPVWPGDCVFPDFTIPRVRRWWGGLYKPFIRMGVDGIWNDMNEPAVFKDETQGTMPLDNHHRGGGNLPAGPHVQYHNVYGMLMVKATREGILKARPEKRPFVLSRANFLGGHRYAATWTGDNNATWKHLKWSIPMSLNLSLSGQPFNGPDIGGFVGNATPELWAHWISVGAFYPFSRAHSAKGTEDQEPWSFGLETERAARTALQRRYRLMPYLYTVFRKAHLTGLPVMQPLFFADPSDIQLRAEDQAFLLGQDMMVVPKWASNARLPRGRWESVSIVGEDVQTDLYQCDIKIRGGAIVPLGPVVQSTQEITALQPLTLIIVLDSDGQATGTLYEDAGDGNEYLQGEYCISTFSARKTGDRVIVKCIQQDGKLASRNRFVSIIVVDENGEHYGFGDVCTSDGVGVMLGIKTEML